MAVSSVYGKPGVKLSPTLAAFTNGVAVRLVLPGTSLSRVFTRGFVLPAFPSGIFAPGFSQGYLCFSKEICTPGSFRRICASCFTQGDL